MPAWASKHRHQLLRHACSQSQPHHSVTPTHPLKLACVPAGRLWLYGDFTKHAGLLGLFYSARKEHNGDCLRLIMGYDNAVNPDTIQEVMLPIARLDLTVNVFKGGVHGIYAPMETRQVRSSAIT